MTFLAFGNGSPDVFSTFSAMRADSGGLAMGELLGAAAFVTSCVVGSMCIIKPFRVEKGPFLRDVGFFTFAVILVLFVLWDSKLEEWEAAGGRAAESGYDCEVCEGEWGREEAGWDGGEGGVGGVVVWRGGAVHGEDESRQGLHA